MHAYVAVPGGKTCYLSELRAGKEVTVVDQSGLWRTAIVGRVKIESRPLVLVEAKVFYCLSPSFFIFSEDYSTCLQKHPLAITNLMLLYT